MYPSENVAAPAQSSNLLTLQITAGDIAAEIFVINGDLFLVDRGVGKLLTKPLSPGIYKIKAKLNEQTWEQHVTLTEPGQEVTIPPFEFSSAAPLAGTAKIDENQVKAAEAASNKIHVSIGQGSCLFVFVREWGASSQPDSTIVQNPMTGLSLHDAGESGKEIVNLENNGQTDASVPNAWGACTIALDPGIYVLRLTLSTGCRYQRMVVGAAGWQTQVFLLMRDYGSVRSADIATGSVLMVRDLGFQSSGDTARQTEMARMALTNERKLFNSELVDMLRGNFENPMLGIFGGHLLLLDQSPDLVLLRQVVNKLKRLVGDRHPDVEALALAAKMPSQYVFTTPPMLRRSWRMVVEATANQVELVPRGSLADHSARSLLQVEPWLTWEMKDTDKLPDADAITTDLEAALQMHALAASPTAMSLTDSPLETVRGLRRNYAPPVTKPLEIAFDAAKIGQLVSILGVPRSTLESMIEEMNASRSAEPDAPTG